MSIGRNLRKYREIAGINQIELAKRMGIGSSMLSQIERGTKTLTLPLAEIAAKELNCSIYDFLDEQKGA